jgi:hypothetical protein
VHTYGLPEQTVAEHVSPDVHALPSLHGFVFATFKQPVAMLQESSVHTLPSLQLSGIPALHEPPPHTSAPLHAFPSPHGDVLFAKTHPLAGLQESSVQPFMSAQTIGVNAQPDAGLHVSIVQALLSLQTTAVPAQTGGQTSLITIVSMFCPAAPVLVSVPMRHRN